ncbi:MAG TPA: hypothetical protein D7H96_07300 [Candidatus Poseidoniales archaeon]|nr:MAG TPA: hypothetical protein D7H96_07300 [Candidatus Poseidoniales archaeon]
MTMQQEAPGRPMRAFCGLWLFLAPCFVAFLAVPVAAAPASEACGTDLLEADWNRTVERTGLVPWNMNYGYYPDEYYYEDDMGGMEGGNGEQTERNTTLHPEEDWMVSWRYPQPLAPLRTSMYATMAVGNDSVGAYRFNLSADHRMTFCVTLYGDLDEDGDRLPVEADVYLLTTKQYERYEQAYNNAHQSYGWWDDIEMLLADRAPELRRYDPMGWTSYRDVHAYESVEEVSFSLSLDKAEVSRSLFNGEVWEDFYLVVDTWDNGHGKDAPSPDSVVYADVSAVATPRSFVMPPASVALVLIVLLGGMVAVPAIVQRRYAMAGLEAVEA